MKIPLALSRRRRIPSGGRVGVVKAKRPLLSLLYTCAMVFAAVLVLRLQILPQLTQGMFGLLSLWALGYGLTDAGLLTIYTIVQRLRARA